MHGSLRACVRACVCRELSPALTNRFTSVWVPALEDEQELLGILGKRLAGAVCGACAIA